jgi:putative FmdB family regulatory protein
MILSDACRRTTSNDFPSADSPGNEAQGGVRAMPIYEYECTQCGKVEEVMQNFSDPPLTTCKHCSGNLHKLISQSAFHLKGTGWYVTDYAGKSGNSGSAKKKESESTSTKEASKTSDKS